MSDTKNYGPDCNSRVDHLGKKFCVHSRRDNGNGIARPVPPGSCQACQFRELPTVTLKLPESSPPVAPTKTTCSTWKKHKAPKIWLGLHVFANSLDVEFPEHTANSDGTFRKYLVCFVRAKIDCPECLAEFDRYFALHQSFNGGYFAWSVDFHNAVNAKCGKPEMSIDEARRMTTATAT